MAQYCRYCACLVYEETLYCYETDKTLSLDSVKRTNNCDKFRLNVMDVLGENPRGYMPRKTQERDKYEQIELEF